jgi:hypothetical protein
MLDTAAYTPEYESTYCEYVKTSKRPSSCGPFSIFVFDNQPCQSTRYSTVYLVEMDPDLE